MKRIFSLFLAMLIFASALSIPAFAASPGSAGTCPYCGSPLHYSSYNVGIAASDKILCTNKDCKYNQTAGRLLGATWENSTGGSGSTTTPSRSKTATAPKKYYTSSGSSGSSGSTLNSFNTINSGNTNYYSTINTTNKTLNYTTYNTTTNNYTYNTYNYTDYNYNYDYNYYTVNTDNSVHYVIDNVNYITVIYPNGEIIDNGDGTTSPGYGQTDIYYQLPSGQNSYNLTPEQVWGEYFLYNVVSCEKVAEDDGTTLGLWHLDGDFSDSSANAGKYTLSSDATTFVDTGVGDFNQAISGTDATFSITGASISPPYTLEFRVYVASSSSYTQFHCFKNYLVACNTKNPSVNSSYKLFPASVLNVYYTDGLVKHSTIIDSSGFFSFRTNQWNTVALCYDGEAVYMYLNGSGSGVHRSPNLTYKGTLKDEYVPAAGYMYACDYDVPFSLSSIGWNKNFDGSLRFSYDEIRLSKGLLYSGASSLSSCYTPSLQPYDTNSVLVLPQNPAENDIAIMSNVPVTNYRIGGVRPTYPITGDVYIYHENDIVKSVQQYQGSGWVAVDAQIYSDGEWKTLKNFNLKDIKSEELETKPLPDVDPEPDEPDPSPGGCDHEYAVTKEKAPTCTESGYTIYKCSICGDTYTDTFKALGHDWQLIESTPSNSGEESPGYTLYRCSRCGEEYKDFEGSGPPADDDDSGFWGWLKDIAGSIFGGLLDVLESIVGGAIGLIVELVDDLFAGIVHVIDSLFAALSKIADFGGAFKDFLAAFFSYIPEEIIVLLAFSISLSIILMIIKFFKG